MFSWAGAGRDMFEKKYRVLSQQFGDLSDDLRDQQLFTLFPQAVNID